MLAKAQSDSFRTSAFVSSLARNNTGMAGLASGPIPPRAAATLERTWGEDSVSRRRMSAGTFCFPRAPNAMYPWTARLRITLAGVTGIRRKGWWAFSNINSRLQSGSSKRIMLVSTGNELLPITWIARTAGSGAPEFSRSRSASHALNGLPPYRGSLTFDLAITQPKTKPAAINTPMVYRERMSECNRAGTNGRVKFEFQALFAQLRYKTARAASATAKLPS